MKKPLWTAPRIWEGRRCYVLAGGASLKSQRYQDIRGPILAVKHTSLLRPDAQVMLWAGKDWHNECPEALSGFRGEFNVRRGYTQDQPANVLSMGRVKGDPVTLEARLSDDPQRLGGWDTGASAINLAYLLGSPEIVLLGFDMNGGHWFEGHPAPFPRQSEFNRHIAGIVSMAKQLEAKGVKVWNCSLKSSLQCFEKKPLDELL